MNNFLIRPIALIIYVKINCIVKPEVKQGCAVIISKVVFGNVIKDSFKPNA